MMVVTIRENGRLRPRLQRDPIDWERQGRAGSARALIGPRLGDPGASLSATSENMYETTFPPRTQSHAVALHPRSVSLLWPRC